MDRHLSQQTSNAPAPSDPSASLRPQALPRGRSWRNWAVIAGVVFGLYVFVGDVVLQPEFQRSTISGRIPGKMVGATTAAATEAKASEARAIDTP